VTRRMFILTALAAVASATTTLRREPRHDDDEWAPGDTIVLYTAPGVTPSGAPARPMPQWRATDWYIDPPNATSTLAGER